MFSFVFAAVTLRKDLANPDPRNRYERKLRCPSLFASLSTEPSLFCAGLIHHLPIFRRERTARLVSNRLLRRYRSLFLWISRASAPPIDSRHALFEDSERGARHGRDQRARHRPLPHDGAHHRATLLLLPNPGMGVEAARQEQGVGQNRRGMH